MQRKALALLIALTIGFFPLSPAASSPLGPDDVSAMVRAMLSMVRIWNAMNGATQWESPDTWIAAPTPYAPPIPAAPWDFNVLSPQGAWAGPAYPFRKPGHDLAGHRQLAEAAARQNHTRLNLSGIWQGASGDVLVIRGNRFRIHNGRGLYSDGTLRLLGNQLVTYVPASGVTRHYGLVQQGDRLALRDTEGQVLLFERLTQSLPRYKKRMIM